jgi:hypothetical protein
LEVFRQYAKNIGARNIYWQYSPAHLQDAWERFQKAVADAWEIAGVNGAAILKKIRALHEARSELRTTQLQRWERGHMAIQDRTSTGPENCDKGMSWPTWSAGSDGRWLCKIRTNIGRESYKSI